MVLSDFAELIEATGQPIGKAPLGALLTAHALARLAGAARHLGRSYAFGVTPVALPAWSLHGAQVSGPVKDWLSFVARMARNPRAIGAVSPASPALAEAMAAQVDFSLPGRVLELGPGTGAVTKALIRRGLGPHRVLAVEADASFARILRGRFPGLDVVEGDATNAGEIERLGPFNAIISSLPLLNFPASERNALVFALLKLVPPGTPFVQYSYGVKPPLPRGTDLRVTLAAKVWRNLPPARVWVFQARAADQDVPQRMRATG